MGKAAIKMLSLAFSEVFGSKCSVLQQVFKFRRTELHFWYYVPDSEKVPEGSRQFMQVVCSPDRRRTGFIPIYTAYTFSCMPCRVSPCNSVLRRGFSPFWVLLL